MRHHAILVTSWQPGAIDAVAKWLDENEVAYSRGDPQINHIETLTIVPDGSKEGWADSERGDEKRDEFVRWASDLYSQNLYCDWVEVLFGDDDPEFCPAQILRSSDWPTPSTGEIDGAR